MHGELGGGLGTEAQVIFHLDYLGMEWKIRTLMRTEIARHSGLAGIKVHGIEKLCLFVLLLCPVLVVLCHPIW